MKKKIIILILTIVILVSGLIVFVVQKKNTKNTLTVAFKTQQECEKATSKACSFSMCDYNCKVYYKGWLPKK